MPRCGESTGPFRGRPSRRRTSDQKRTLQNVTPITGQSGRVAPSAPPTVPSHAPGERGWWVGPADGIQTDPTAIAKRVCDLSRSVCLIHSRDDLAVADGGAVYVTGDSPSVGQSQTERPLAALVPALPISALGDATFTRDHGVRYPYMTGAMANGIASVELVEAGARAGFLSAYGAAGQRIDVIRDAIDRLQASLGDTPFAFNLIHSPNEPAHESAVVDLYIERGVHLVEASAYLDLTLPAVKYRVHGIHRDASSGGGGGQIVTPNRVVAKASRIEVATRWLSPPPKRMLDELVNRGDITHEQAELASQVPMAQDLTAEADSGGHTDNRPAVTLVPTMIALRDRLSAEHGYGLPIRVGAAGGIATPWSAAAAFAMGAGYIVTGTVNQACVESGSSDAVRDMLAQTEQADVTMAPAADMFEMGVKLQVLKRGTMFAMRAQKLYDLYKAYDSLDVIPDKERASIEKTVFRATLQDVWQRTRDYFNQYDPSQVARAERDAKHQMALTFRWYLGLSSRWANAGEADRKIDYQVWCGPAMGAFNEWTRGSFLQTPTSRDTATVGLNLLYGAAVVTRLNVLRQQGVIFPVEAEMTRPQTRQAIEAMLH